MTGGVGTTAIEVYRGDNGIPVVKAAHFDDLDLLTRQLQSSTDPFAQQAFAAMASWTGMQRMPANRQVKGIFDRNRYVTPTTTFEKIRVARDATRRDDIVGGAADVTEGLALKDMSVHASDPDQKDIWNQIAADLDLDNRVREAWRGLFTDSQLIGATWWEHRNYTTRVPTATGKKSKASKLLQVPTRLTWLDPTKVTPVGTLMFGAEMLAFIANPEEAQILDEILAHRDGLTVPARRRQTIEHRDDQNRMLAPTTGGGGLALHDPIVRRLVVSRYRPERLEERDLREDGVDPTNLFLFDPRFVFRHTLTKLHSRFADVRLESVMELLDAKAQLRGFDRANLIGGANYIVLITKGSDKIAADQGEIDNLRANVRTLGSIPVLVGDHRLKVEIVAPTNDHTLEQERHDVIDSRIQARVWGTFAATGNDTADPLKLGAVIAAGLESRRKMLGRAIETYVFQMIRDANPTIMTDRAKLRFHPGTIALAFDSTRMTFLMDMRNNRQISRDTLLSESGFDQADEAEMIEIEAESYDPIFKEQVAFTGGQAGRELGGNRNGGGAAPGTRQGKTTVDPQHSDTGPNKTRAVRAELVDAWEAAGHRGDDADTMLSALASMSRPDLIVLAGLIEDPIAGRHHARRDDLRAALASYVEANLEEPEDA